MNIIFPLNQLLTWDTVLRHSSLLWSFLLRSWTALARAAASHLTGTEVCILVGVLAVSLPSWTLIPLGLSSHFSACTFVF